MKFKKKNVKVFVLVTTVLLFILTFVLAISIFGDISQEVRNEPFGNGDALEWHESLDLILARYNNIKIEEDVEREVIECIIFMAQMPRKAYKQYRREYDLEGYSEIAESYIDYDWIEIVSKKLKF